MSGESYYPPPPPPSKQPPPAAYDCTDGPGLHLTPSLDIELDLGGMTSAGGLATAKLLQLDLGGASIAVDNPIAPGCPDQQDGALVSADIPDMPLGIFGGSASFGDLVHAGLGDTTLKVGNPFTSEPASVDTSPLIRIDAQNLPLIGESMSDDDGSGTLLAGLLGGGDGATHLLSGLLAPGDSGGDSDCGCSSILQPVVDFVLDPVDALLA